MSQRSTPRSPRSKSPSCQEGEDGSLGSSSHGRVIDEMRMQLEEELESSERFINAANNPMADSKGSRIYSRPGSVPDGSRSRIGSPLRSSSRPPTGYDNELPSPSRTASAHVSRGISSGVSRVSTRLPTPEFSSSKSRAGSPLLGNRVDRGVSNPAYGDLYEMTSYLDIATSYNSRDVRARTPSEITGESNLNGTGFFSSGQQSSESRGARGQTTYPASRETMGLSSAAGFSTSTGTMSGLNCGVQRPECCISGSLAPGVSATSKKQFSYKDESISERVCKAGCRRHHDEVERTAVAVGPSVASLRNPVSGLSENIKHRSGQLLYPQEDRQAEREHLVHTSGRGTNLPRTHAGHEQLMRSPQMPSMHHHHHHGRRAQDEPRRDDRKISALAHLSQLKKTPSYLMCGVNQNVDFLNVCSPKESKTIKLPERPCLQQEEITELIKCERQDVDSAWYLASEESKIYKKPCPKQQKAQMNVRSIVKAHSKQTCGEKYTPLEHPDPDDISPEVAASMMFSQEQGIKMDACPKETIMHLFPDEFKQPFPEKILRSSISIVDPNQKDREDLIEKSAGVPSEGVSDSAYTRTMKEKGEDMQAQKSYDVDFAIGQSKREYVLVAQKPQRFSKIQFRGGNLPSWFPGYFTAFPDEDGGIKPISSPSGLFHKAWFHTNPRNMPTNDVIVLE